MNPSAKFVMTCQGWVRRCIGGTHQRMAWPGERPGRSFVFGGLGTGKVDSALPEWTRASIKLEW